MEFKEGLKILKGMCAQAPENCEGCPLDVTCPFGLLPHEWSDNDPERVVAAAEEWKEKHRLKTMLEVLKERFPYAPMRGDDDNMPVHCPTVYFGEGVPMACKRLTRCEPCDACRECWNRFAPDEYQEKG